ncbi:zinc dependent phospholipase C family protein [Virgibacillus flavescens]|uniref:zinc dependent phospholipase C family protein n=1 Tax=Virgibacillus flavescens TaxID=1611422 RepID=UPI003D34C8F5
MPNIWTHMLFCEEVVDTINNPTPFFQHEAYMKLGAQGPDPFFYYNFWPWNKDESVSAIGMALHTKKCGEFLLDLVISAANMDSKVKAYVFGFVTHHILDRNTHPYIHYRAGYEGSKHQELEVKIDTVMMDKFHNMKTWKAHVHKEIDVGYTLDKEIKQLLQSKIKKHYPEVCPDSASYIQKSYRDMKLALKILSDPYGWKNVLLKSLISSYSHQPIKNNVDYLNEKENTWHHPATNEPSSQSFLELYEIGRAEGIEILSEILAYWDNPLHSKEEQIKTLIGNISYDTGKPLELNLRNKYSEPIV